MKIILTHYLIFRENKTLDENIIFMKNRKRMDQILTQLTENYGNNHINNKSYSSINSNAENQIKKNEAVEESLTK